LDHPKKITLTLAEACHQQLDELCAHFEAEPNRRTAVTRSEMVEQAVAALHLATIKAKTKTKRESHNPHR
jgi:hypothetical protein